MRRNSFSVLRVRSAAGRPQRGWLTGQGLIVPVALGRGGIRADKREGDGSTPSGVFHPVRLWWRADRLPRPVTTLPVRPIAPDDAWCEDPADRRYNRPIRLRQSLGSGGDQLTRDDALYDVIVEIDHNTRPRVKGRGSAVFLHIARDNFGPSAGCVTMPRTALLRLITRLDRRTRIIIG